MNCWNRQWRKKPKYVVKKIAESNNHAFDFGGRFTKKSKQKAHQISLLHVDGLWKLPWITKDWVQEKIWPLLNSELISTKMNSDENFHFFRVTVLIFIDMSCSCTKCFKSFTTAQSTVYRIFIFNTGNNPCFHLSTSCQCRKREQIG